MGSRAVGDAAGISESAPYRHYADKRALLTRWCDALSNSCAGRWRAPGTERTPRSLRSTSSSASISSLRAAIRFAIACFSRKAAAIASWRPKRARRSRRSRTLCTLHNDPAISGMAIPTHRRAHLRGCARYGGPRAVRPHQGRIRFGLLARSAEAPGRDSGARGRPRAGVAVVGVPVRTPVASATGGR